MSASTATQSAPATVQVQARPASPAVNVRTVSPTTTGVRVSSPAYHMATDAYPVRRVYASETAMGRISPNATLVATHQLDPVVVRQEPIKLRGTVQLMDERVVEVQQPVQVTRTVEEPVVCCPPTVVEIPGPRVVSCRALEPIVHREAITVQKKVQVMEERVVSTEVVPVVQEVQEYIQPYCGEVEKHTVGVRTRYYDASEVVRSVESVTLGGTLETTTVAMYDMGIAGPLPTTPVSERDLGMTGPLPTTHVATYDLGFTGLLPTTPLTEHDLGFIGRPVVTSASPRASASYVRTAGGYVPVEGGYSHVRMQRGADGNYVSSGAPHVRHALGAASPLSAASWSPGSIPSASASPAYRLVPQMKDVSPISTASATQPAAPPAPVPAPVAAKA